MADIRFVEGDILNGKCNIICQSVNHKGVMGSGLARQIRDRYPNIMGGYIGMCNTHTFRSIMRNGLTYFHTVVHEDGGVQQIASIFGQDGYGRDRRHTNYSSLINGLMWVFEFAESMNYSIAIPYGIGCGLGGGQWDIVLMMIKDALAYYPHLKVYIYKNSPLDK